MRPDGVEAGESRPRVTAINPDKVGEDRFGVLPAALAPGAQAEAVEGPKERAVVDEPAQQHPGEPIGQGLLGDSDSGVVQLERGLGALGIEGDVAQVHPRVDAALVLRDETPENACRVSVLAGSV